jgi:hypothetical protein
MTTSKRAATNFYSDANVKNRNRQKQKPSELNPSRKRRGGPV